MYRKECTHGAAKRSSQIIPSHLRSDQCFAELKANRFALRQSLNQSSNKPRPFAGTSDVRSNAKRQTHALSSAALQCSAVQRAAAAGSSGGGGASCSPERPAKHRVASHRKSSQEPNQWGSARGAHSPNNTPEIRAEERRGGEQRRGRKRRVFRVSRLDSHWRRRRYRHRSRRVASRRVE